MTGDSYRKTTLEAEFTLKERRSEFIATLVPVDTVDTARAEIDRISKKYSDARHNCWAYRVGYPTTQEYSSDDGEPSGSAGKPIMGSIVKADLYDLAIVVTRYFGGVKLGVRGLINAYSGSAEGAINLSSWTKKTVTSSYYVSTGYDHHKDCLHYIKSCGIEDSFITPSYGEKVTLSIEAPLSTEETLVELLSSLKQRGIVETWNSTTD